MADDSGKQAAGKRNWSGLGVLGLLLLSLVLLGLIYAGKPAPSTVC